LRVWDVPVERLCRQHLLGQHNEIHAMFSVITKGTKGWSNHPETKRWKGKLKALYLKHNETAEEMINRGYNHQSPLSKNKAKGKAKQDYQWESTESQIKKLKEKGCDCDLKGL